MFKSKTLWAGILRQITTVAQPGEAETVTSSDGVHQSFGCNRKVKIACSSASGMLPSRSHDHVLAVRGCAYSTSSFPVVLMGWHSSDAGLTVILLGVWL